MKRQKRYLFFYTAILSLLLPGKFVLAEEQARVIIDNREISFQTQPQIVNDRILVPMRTIFEELGYEIDWDDSKKAVSATNGVDTIWLQIGNTSAYKNDFLLYLDTPAQIINDQTMVPLRFLSEASGMSIDWIEETKTAVIHTKVDLSYTTSDTVVMLHALPTAKQGSGVILENGLIVTNFHVLEGIEELSVIFNDNTVYSGKAYLAGYDTSLDVAFIRIEKEGLPYAVMGNSDTVSKEDSVTAIGSPLGVKNKVTTGKITNTAHDIFCNTAPIDHGSSGGALYNSENELIGITYSYDTGGNSYAIPINLIKNIPVDLNSTTPLRDIQKVDTSLQKITDISLTYEDNKAHLYWRNVYGADGYILYQSTTSDGKFTPVTNPLTNTPIWNWGYPYCFTLTSKSGNYVGYYKVAPVKNGEIGPLSDRIKIQINAGGVSQ